MSFQNEARDSSRLDIFNSEGYNQLSLLDPAAGDVGDCRISQHQAVAVLENSLNTGNQAAGRPGE